MNTADRPLEEMASAVAFEFYRFDFAARLPEFRRSDDLGGLVRETFLIHFRNLLAFFYGMRKHQSDTLAVDYLDQISPWNPHVPVWLDEYRRRCNKLLAHLSYERVEYLASNRRTWDLEDKVRYITEEWRAFWGALPLERRNWFRMRSR